KCLRLIAARGLACEGLDANDVRYPGDLPIVTRLGPGEGPASDPVPSHAMPHTRVPVQKQRAFAAPMVCHGSFEGALVVGYDASVAQHELLAVGQGAASQAALAAATVRSVERQQEDTEVTGTLLELSQQLSACL